jgi:hypothetical protein
MRRLLCQRDKGPQYPLDRRLGRPQSRSGCGGEDKISQPLPGLEPLIIQHIAQCYITELLRLLIYLCSSLLILHGWYEIYMIHKNSMGLLDVNHNCLNKTSSSPWPAIHSRFHHYDHASHLLGSRLRQRERMAVSMVL